MAARVGLTGGIGSGKSTVSALFCETGIMVIDADKIAREVTLPGTPWLNKIAHHFGHGVLLQNGELNRKKLSEIVFSSADQRKWLEQLLHPEIRSRMDTRAASCADSYCILEIPLLIESARHLDMDKTIVVHCNSEIRRSRLIASRGMNAESIDAVMRNQASEQERLDVADYVVDNSGTLDQLKPQVTRIHQELTRIFSNKEN